MTPFQYEGDELELFSKASNWKKYFSQTLIPFIQGRVLEVGAGIGETTRHLYNSKVTSWTCLEPDEGFCAVIQKLIDNGNLPQICKVKHGHISSLNETDFYDTIIYIDVLEHIAEDKDEIKRATKHLTKNGHVLILSPAFQMLYNQFDQAIGHYRRYSKKTLRSSVKTPQLKEKKIFYLESLGVFLLLINKLLARKSYPTHKQVLFWDKIIVPMSRVMDKIFLHSFGKTIIGIWQYQPNQF